MRGTALAFRFLIVGSILTSPVARPAETALRVSEGWTATPLTTDSPQSPILQFGDQFSLPSGELVFWGRIRDGRDGWALFSLRADRLRTILVEGESSVSRYGEPNARLHLHYRGTEMLHRPTRIFAGRVLVISTEEAIGNGGSVYAWVGDLWLRRVSADASGVVTIDFERIDADGWSAGVYRARLSSLGAVLTPPYQL
jgi:hypothetical protein